MNAPVNPTDPPMAEPGKRPTGGDVGGVIAAPQTGVADSAQRSKEKGGNPAPGRARGGDPAPGRVGSGTAAPEASAQREEDDEDDRRHEPVAPVDEPNPLRSLGKAVGETVTGSDPGTDTPRRR
jgi:hypothetical protein